MLRDELIEKLAQNGVDGMDMNGLIEYAKDKLTEWYDKQSNRGLERLAESELCETVKITRK